MLINIRPEKKVDKESIYEINTLAFKRENEAKLINKIRESRYFIPELSLVAETEKEKLIGHILFSKVSIETNNGEVPTIALGPVAVLPNYQQKGVGSALINKGISIAKELGYKSIIVLGHATYYPKFGFSKASEKGIKSPFPVPDEVFMILELTEGALEGCEGTVKYSEPFLNV